MAAIATSYAGAAAICFSAAKCSLRSWLYCVNHGLGRRLFGGGGSVIWVEGVALAPTVGACGMWKEEEDGGRVWITCLDRQGRAARRRVAGEEAAVLQARSEGFNLERKAERGEMWLLVRGRGRGGRYFRGSRKFGIASAKKTSAQSVIRHGPIFRAGCGL